MFDSNKKVAADTKFIYFYIAAVYGKLISTLPIKESVKLNQLSPYGLHKLSAGEVCRDYSRLFGIHHRNHITYLPCYLGYQKGNLFAGIERTADPAYWRADISFLQRLGYSPHYKLQSGLAHLAECIKAPSPTVAGENS